MSQIVKTHPSEPCVLQCLVEHSADKVVIIHGPAVRVGKHQVGSLAVGAGQPVSFQQADQIGADLHCPLASLRFGLGETIAGMISPLYVQDTQFVMGGEKGSGLEPGR